MSKRFKRKINIREEYTFIYIFTNGEKTEINYFNDKKSEIRRNDIKIKPEFINSDPLKLVEKVVEKVIEEINRENEYWVVFDKDNFDKDFDNAINKAEANGLKVAYSNEAFELWFLLHFNPMSSAIDRKDYNIKLTENFRKLTKDKQYKYDKVESVYPLIKIIKNRESDAIRNAKKLLEQHKKEKSFLKKNPSTTVHLLVEKLNKLKL